MPQTITLKLGDSFKVIPTLKDVGAVICDPPYLISFMGKKWDDIEGENQEWFAEWITHCFDILPPGGVVKIFSGTRTFHRLAAAMAQVGFVDLQTEAWIYGSGFPKSLNISKALDKAAGAEREIVGIGTGKGGENINQSVRPGKGDTEDAKGCGAYGVGAKQTTVDIPITASTSEEAKRFDGWGTALKPAWEPFVVGYKPIEETT